MIKLADIRYLQTKKSLWFIGLGFLVLILCTGGALAYYSFKPKTGASLPTGGVQGATASKGDSQATAAGNTGSATGSPSKSGAASNQKSSNAAKSTSGTGGSTGAGGTPTGSNTTPVPTPTPPPTPTPNTIQFYSGAAVNGASDGSFGIWRGTAVQIGGTWNDSLDAQTALYTIKPGAEWGSWDGPLDIAIGAIYSSNGETWAAAASGSYDNRWRTSLNNLKTYRGSKTGTTYIRFAHEFNGNWTPWAVTGSNSANFVSAWKRFRALQQEIFPQAKLVFCPNDGTSGSLSLDWRNAFPGASYVDVMSVDTYNQYPWVNTVTNFNSKINSTDSYGAPLGIEKHRQFALSQGLPFAVSEWSSNADMGDAPVYIEQFYNWVSANKGNGAGNVKYEILFNSVSYGTGQFSLYPTTRQPLSAAKYQQLF